MADTPDQTLIALTADIVAAHVSHNKVASADLGVLIARVHGALSGLGEPQAAPQVELTPAVSVRSSVKPDHIICLEDGKKMKMLKRHLATDHGLTPAEYRNKWKLPADYPMVASNYAAQRKDLALKIGLGRKPAETTQKKPAPKTGAKPKLSAKFAGADATQNASAEKPEALVPVKRASAKKPDAPSS